ncbi:MAG TPA: MBL fold metallo-hydrolase, partial [Chthoniobacterales bacterium]|nr:MBL fold metallo-hydrolase [Chthoniobacterales bacterium]
LPNVASRVQVELGKTGMPTLLVNTHWHYDHTGGNEALAKAGARIVAHEKCRERLGSEQYVEPLDRRQPASPRAALPLMTFTTPMALHLNARRADSCQCVLRIPTRMSWFISRKPT